MSGKMTPGILTGNIADKGIYFREDSVPQGMDCFRGPARIFESFGQAAGAVEAGEIIPGTAIAVFPKDGSAGDPEALEKAVKGCGLDGKICLLTDSDPRFERESCAAFFYGSPGERKASRAFLLADGDVVEYDLKKGILNADITEEGTEHRASGGRPDDLTVTEIGPGTWALTERYSRMFLLKGSEKTLLIDTAFGISDARGEAEKLAGGTDMVFLTHGHWDHIGGAVNFDRVYMNAADRPLIPEALRGRLEPYDLEPGTVADLGGRHIEVIACPGHTPGGLCFLDVENRMLFAGDSVAEGPTYLFLDHSSAETLLNSLKGLLGRRGEYDAIYSAHRRMKLDAGWIEDMIKCVEMTLAGKLAGEPACVARTNGSCQKYSYGKVSVFLP